MIEKRVSSPQGDTWYWIVKNPKPDAPCIVFTHGLTADHRMFMRQVGFFSHAFTVVTWDIPMHGKSRPYERFSYENAAEELCAILTAEGIEKAVLTGMSLGGYVCQVFAARFPEKAIAFISIDSTPYDIAYYSKSDRFWLCLAAPACRWFPDKTLRRSIANANSISPEGRQVMLEMLESLSKADICEQMDIAYGRFLTEVRDAKNVLSGIPTLLLLGEKDRTGKVAAYNRAWAMNTGYPLVIIPNAAHLSNIDNCHVVNQAIESFLAKALPSI